LAPQGFFAGDKLDINKIWQDVRKSKNFICHFAYVCLVVAHAERQSDTRHLNEALVAIAWMRGDLKSKERPGVRLEALSKKVHGMQASLQKR
jgi:hypothetical protein